MMFVWKNLAGFGWDVAVEAPDERKACELVFSEWGVAHMMVGPEDLKILQAALTTETPFMTLRWNNVRDSMVYYDHTRSPAEPVKENEDGSI